MLHKNGWGLPILLIGVAIFLYYTFPYLLSNHINLQAEQKPVVTPAPIQNFDPLLGAAHITWTLLFATIPIFIIIGSCVGLYILFLRGKWQSSMPRQIDSAPPLWDREMSHRFYDMRIAQAHHPLSDLTHLNLRDDHSYRGAHSKTLDIYNEQHTKPIQQTLTLNEALALPGIVIGSTSSGPLRLEGELTSVGIGGMPHSGKSATVASFVYQHLGMNHRVMLADPHAQNERSLTQYLQPLLEKIELKAGNHLETLNLVRDAYQELQGRINSRAHNGHLVIVIDEWTSLLLGKLAERIVTFLVPIIVEGQKHKVTCILAAHNWTAAQAGGSILRNPIPTTIAHRMRPVDMNALTGLRGQRVPADILDLQPGHAYAVGYWGINKIVVPKINIDSTLTLPSTSLVSALSDPPNNGQNNNNQDDTRGDRRVDPFTLLTQEEQKIVRLFREGNKIPAIILAVMEKTSNDGKQYIRAREYVESVILKYTLSLERA